MRPRILDDLSEAIDPIVKLVHPVKLICYWLRARQIRQCALQGREEAGDVAMARGARRRRVGVDIDQPSIDLSICRTAANGRNSLAKRPVVEHAAIEKAG